MGVFEKYYMFSAASERVSHLLASGKCVKAWRDIEDGSPVWKVEWNILVELTVLGKAKPHPECHPTGRLPTDVLA